MCENHPQPPITFLRGLDARCCWAAAQDGADPECGDGGAHGEAFSQGVTDFQNAREENDVPPLLADVPYLAASWRAGWAFSEEVERMASCRDCQDPNVDIYPIHG